MNPDRIQRAVTVPANAHVLGPAFMFSSALLFTVLDVLIKILGPGYRVWDIGFYRFTLGLVILLIVLGRHGNPFKGGGDTGLLILRGICGSCAFLAMIASIRMIPLSTAVALFFAFPAFAALFSKVLYRQKLQLPDTLCILMTLLGVCLIFDFRMEGLARGQILAVVGSAMAGLTICIIKKLRETNGPFIIYLYFCVLGSLICFPAFTFDPQIPQGGMEWLMVAGILICSLGGQLMMNQGSSYCKSWEGGVFLTSEVIFTAVFGILVLGEPSSWRLWAGTFCILSSVFTLNRRSARDP